MDVLLYSVGFAVALAAGGWIMWALSDKTPPTLTEDEQSFRQW